MLLWWTSFVICFAYINAQNALENDVAASKTANEIAVPEKPDAALKGKTSVEAIVAATSGVPDNVPQNFPLTPEVPTSTKTEPMTTPDVGAGAAAAAAATNTLVDSNVAFQAPLPQSAVQAQRTKMREVIARLAEEQLKQQQDFQRQQNLLQSQQQRAESLSRQAQEQSSLQALGQQQLAQEVQRARQLQNQQILQLRNQQLLQQQNLGEVHSTTQLGNQQTLQQPLQQQPAQSTTTTVEQSADITFYREKIKSINQLIKQIDEFIVKPNIRPRQTELLKRLKIEALDKISNIEKEARELERQNLIKAIKAKTSQGGSPIQPPTQSPDELLRKDQRLLKELSPNTPDLSRLIGQQSPTGLVGDILNARDMQLRHRVQTPGFFTEPTAQRSGGVPQGFLPTRIQTPGGSRQTPQLAQDPRMRRPNLNPSEVSALEAGLLNSQTPNPAERQFINEISKVIRNTAVLEPSRAQEPNKLERLQTELKNLEVQRKQITRFADEQQGHLNSLIVERQQATLAANAAVQKHAERRQVLINEIQMLQRQQRLAALPTGPTNTFGRSRFSQNRNNEQRLVASPQTRVGTSVQSPDVVAFDPSTAFPNWFVSQPVGPVFGRPLTFETMSSTTSRSSSDLSSGQTVQLPARTLTFGVPPATTLPPLTSQSTQILNSEVLPLINYPWQIPTQAAQIPASPSISTSQTRIFGDQIPPGVRVIQGAPLPTVYIRDPSIPHNLAGFQFGMSNLSPLSVGPSSSEVIPVPPSVALNAVQSSFPYRLPETFPASSPIPLY